MEGPSNGHREERDEKKPEEAEKKPEEATSSDGKSCDCVVLLHFVARFPVTKSTDLLAVAFLAKATNHSFVVV